MKILIPVENESDAKLILDFVVNYHFPPKSKINIFHAIDPEHHGTEEREISMQAFLDRLKTKVQSFIKGADVTTTILDDRAVNAILHLVTTWKPDMVIMGYRTRAHDGNLAAGSVSRSIAAQVPCSVVIIRPPVYQPSLLAEDELEPVFTG